MKKLISTTGGMNTFLEIKPVAAVAGLTHLRITSTYDGAKNPEDERVHFDLCLEPTDLANIKAALSEFSV
jgi:hypothetical protein